MGVIIIFQDYYYYYFFSIHLYDYCVTREQDGFMNKIDFTNGRLQNSESARSNLRDLKQGKSWRSL